jgi:hypothetical protein
MLIVIAFVVCPAAFVITTLSTYLAGAGLTAVFLILPGKVMDRNWREVKCILLTSSLALVSVIFGALLVWSGRIIITVPFGTAYLLFSTMNWWMCFEFVDSKGDELFKRFVNSWKGIFKTV